MASDSGGAPHLERTITLTGAVALAVGGVVGAGIYTLIAPIADGSGDALWLSFVIAMAVSLVGVLPVIQLASALPRAGVGYFFTSRLLSPIVGTVSGIVILIGGAGSTCVVSLSFAAYVAEYINVPIPIHLFAIVLVLLFYCVYLIGVRLAMGLQIIMAAQLVLALLIYTVAGLAQVDLQFGATPPAGPGPFFITVLLCYNTCMGFQVLAEMGEEIRDARRTIPKALVISAAIITVMYVMVGSIFMASLPDEAGKYYELSAPLNTSAVLLLPGWVVVFVNFGAISAALTSLNAAAVALPREIFAQARDGIYPPLLARVDKRTHTPLAAVTAYIAVVVALVSLGRDVDFYGLLTALGIQGATVLICVASLRLKSMYPNAYAQAYFHVPWGVLLLCTIITILVTAGFTFLVAVERPTVLVIYTVAVLGGAVYHVARTRWLDKQGIPWRDRVHAIPDGELAASEAGPE